jgi:3-(3-hydroxy-phenyl)propionate hydroxylase
MMVIEMPNGIVRTFISVPDPGPDVKTTTLEEVNAALNELGQVDAELYDPVWVALFRVNHRAAPVFRRGRILIAGDAAHEHVPIGGQGMNTGIQDAFNLAWKLAYTLRGKATEKLLDTFEAERHPVAESLLRGTDEAYTKLLAAGDLGRIAVRLLGPYLLGSEWVREKMRNTIEEIGINYRQGSLTEDHGGSEGPQAGDRVLDANVVEARRKQTVPLREVLRGTQWTVLAFSGRGAKAERIAELSRYAGKVQSHFGDTVRAYVVAEGFPIVAQGENILLDPMGQLHDVYGVGETCLYGMRPDCYVGFRGGIEHGEKLLQYLEKFLVAKGG